MKTFKFFKMLAVLILLITSINTAWAGTKTTVYYAISASDQNCYTVKLNVAFEYNNGSAANFHQYNMEKTAYTKDGKLIYSCTYTDSYNGVGTMQFQLYDGGTYKSQQQPYGSWTSVSTYNGKMYVHNTGWTNFSHDDSYTIYFVDKYWNHDVDLYAWNSSCDYNDAAPGQRMTFTGCYWNGKKIYRLVLNKRYDRLKFSEVGGSGGYYDNQPCYTNAGKMFTPDEKNWWQTPSYTSYTFSNGATVVWDAGSESWTSAYMYNFNLDSDNDIDLKRIGTTQQFYKTATSDVVAGAWVFRGAKDWEHGKTTDVTTNISGVTLVTYMGPPDTDYKMNWQVTSNAKKATGSTKVYFDNTDAKWSSIYLKYGTNWTSGGYTRATSAATKVNGTDNLYCITIPNDAYYKEYFLCDATGSTGYVDIETMTSINNRIGYQESNISSEITYIPTSGAGTPKVWTASTMSGHEHNVTITAPSHGTITVAYKNENNVSQSQTSGSFPVARTCSLTISATADEGYKLATDGLTIDDVAHTSGSVYIIKDDITIEATFEAKQCTITFDKEGGTGGDNSTTATFAESMTIVSVPHKIGYAFAGYYIDEDCEGTKYYNADGTSATDWNENTEDPTTLYAKWVEDVNTFTNTDDDGDWSNANNWSAGKVPTNDYSAITIDGNVTISSYVHIGQLTIGEGKLTISSTGTLEVAGTVTNSNADKLEIQTTTSSQGALIYDIASPPAATVIMTLNGSGFHLIASPTGGARVSSTFAGSGIYTYAWEEGKGWDRRGYYDDFVGNEAILIYGQTNCNFSGTLANYCGGSLRYTDEPDVASAQGVNMLANPLTAPIRIANMTISNSEDGAVHLYNGSWVGKAPGSAGEAVIPAMQGYGVIASSGGGTVSFDYDVAVRRASSKNAPLNAPKRTDSDIQDHITVSVTTNDRKVDLELYENAQFTEGIDVGWEAIYMEGSGQFGELYAIADKKMNILATPNLEGTVLGFVPGQAESYVISFEGDGKGYYLNDTELELSTLIDEGNTYEFTPNESTNATRFVISKTPIRNTPTGLEEVSEGTKARKQLIDGVLYIIRDGRIYNTTGALYK